MLFRYIPVTACEKLYGKNTLCGKMLKLETLKQIL